MFPFPVWLGGGGGGGDRPFSGIRKAMGREMGVMECWYTRADRLPARQRKRGGGGGGGGGEFLS